MIVTINPHVSHWASSVKGWARPDGTEKDD